MIPDVSAALDALPRVTFDSSLSRVNRLLLYSHLSPLSARGEGYLGRLLRKPSISPPEMEGRYGIQIRESYSLQHRVSFRCVAKYRYKVLTEDGALRVRELVRQTCEAFEIQIIKSVVSKDYVHIFVSAPPTMAPSEIMFRIKGRTSSKLFEEFPHLRKRYWGRHFWARGYFCHTSGQVTDEMIKTYLEHHFDPSKDYNFKPES